MKKSLEDRVHERTAELSSRNGEMRVVFDNIAEGLFMVDEKGHLSSEQIRLDPKRWSPVWTTFVHLLRNAVDHGIESSEQRRASGKSETGRIALRARREAATIVIVIGIEDDGRGIDWEAIRRQCVARSLPSGTQDELVAALFTDGLSTAERVTDLSGRGVGMGALQSAVHALGGNISVHSERGIGARVSISFPTLGAAAAGGAGSSAPS